MNKKQKILAIVVLSLTLILAGVMLCSAQQASSTPIESGGTTIGQIRPSVIGVIFGVVTNIVGFFGGILFNLAGGLTNFVLLLNFDILNNPMINVGWGIARDLANLGFVLFIIIIAIATILRIQQYEAKSTLGKLIAVALLVNFSLLFAGAFIDFSNMLTGFFIKSATNGDLATTLANAFKIQNLLRVSDAGSAMQGVMQFGKSMEVGIASSFFVAAFTLIGAFSLLTLAMMFLVRVVALSILLVLIPLACLFIILPTTKNIWNKWWKEFLGWILFGPTASFFIYLAVYMTVNYGKLMDNLAVSSQGVGTANQMNFANLIIKDPLIQIGRMLIIIGLLTGGLIVAKSASMMGASAGIGMAQATKKRLTGVIGNLAAGSAQKTFMGGMKRDATTGKTTTRGQRMAATISRVPGFQGVAQRISAFSSPQARAADVETYRKNNLVNLSNDALIRQMTVPGAFTNRTAAAAMIQDAARRKLTDDTRIAPLLEKYIQAAQGMGNINTVLNSRPDLAPIAAGAKTDAEKADAIRKTMSRIRADKADEISHDALGQINVALSLDNSKLKRIGTVGDDRQKNAIQTAIDQAINNIQKLTAEQQTALNRIEAQVRTLRDGGNW